MGSLSAHLRAPEDHARLPFHPDCPVCRSERLTGRPAVGWARFAPDASGPRRGRARLLAAAPAAVLAAETDQEQQGATAPGPAGGADTTGNPDFDPGGASTDLPSDAPPVPQPEAPSAGSNDDAAPLDQEPATDVDAPVADAGDEPAGPTRSNPPRPRLPLSRPPPATLSSRRPLQSGPDRGCASGSDGCARLVAHQRHFATPSARAPSGHEAGGEARARPSPSAGARLCPRCLR